MRIAFLVATVGIVASGATVVLPSLLAEEEAPEAPPPSFPANWAGIWEGELAIHSPGRREQKVQMELRIEATEDPVRWCWAIRYGSQPTREYRLVVVDALKGGYAVDEGNSIVLPATLVGGALVSSFSVSGNRLTASYRLDGEELHFLIHVTSAEPTATTGGEDQVPEVKAYGVRSVHRATLRRSE